MNTEEGPSLTETEQNTPSIELSVEEVRSERCIQVNSTIESVIDQEKDKDAIELPI